MPTINEVITRVDTNKNNSFDISQKVDFIIDFEHILYNEVFDNQGLKPNDTKELDKPLFLSRPYDKLYDYYLASMIDYYNEDFESYSVSMSMFNSFFDQYKKYYIRNKPNTSRCSFRNLL